MIRQPVSTTQAMSLMLTSVVLLLASYTYMSHRQHEINARDTTMPSWSQIADGVTAIVTPNERTGEVWLLNDATATGKRLFYGLSIGMALSFILGIAMGCNAKVEHLFRLPLSGFAKIPPTAAMVVFFILAGLNEKMYVSMIVFGVMPTLTLSTYLAVKDVPMELIRKSYTLGASNAEVVWDVVVKMILPRFLDSVRLIIGAAVVALIAAELEVGQVGFGYRIRLEYHKTNMSVIYPYVAVLIAFGYGMDWTIKGLQRHFCGWFTESNGRKS
jgi:ABC-type nitrate/sulfonate/bicarbonate transport system permease component